MFLPPEYLRQQGLDVQPQAAPMPLQMQFGQMPMNESSVTGAMQKVAGLRRQMMLNQHQQNLGAGRSEGPLSTETDPNAMQLMPKRTSPLMEGSLIKALMGG